jgi:BTB/POZ domain
MASLSPESLLHLFQTGEFADFVIKCKDRDFKVHRMIICPESSYFKAVATRGFLVGESFFHLMTYWLIFA